MRIVAGRLRGKAVAVPDGVAVRPTSDRSRGALFNILEHRFQGRDGFSLHGARVLDAFAGSGALGLEALSRGAAFVTFIEQAAPARAVLGQNIRACDAGANTRLVAGDALRPPRADSAADLIFLDPPYGLELVVPALRALEKAGWLTPRTLVFAETDARSPAPSWPGGTVLLDERVHSRARLTFLRVGPAPDDRATNPG
ncbi:16S rRNA (guanine(966)-N(2))-methyltransferase RsmD [Phaeovibrio sulfidiphilus]|uniref:16S rRNA (Guanine(966)-N(2))-methyltransferase RsmD n=1 Tax=Phaeovibrio sulfidiphilus TaxID=1220600 RepID=A0A8J6Z187_9PROT|nr:16S rRNA (guanine(966)-N(2))-methyltransferase RsmD [Phaeovibrio sulfidiphilus]MBE1237898.1 16S rRNA (guanine(966)-N(2))-methyltransferase RsmD [Phaeovibrio sulfidiphilus]